MSWTCGRHQAPKAGRPHHRLRPGPLQGRRLHDHAAEPKTATTEWLDGSRGSSRVTVEFTWA